MMDFALFQNRTTLWPFAIRSRSESEGIVSILSYGDGVHLLPLKSASKMVGCDQSQSSLETYLLTTFVVFEVASILIIVYHEVLPSLPIRQLDQGHIPFPTICVGVMKFLV